MPEPRSHQSTDPKFEPADGGFEVVDQLGAPPPWVGRRHQRVERREVRLQRFVDRERERRPRRWITGFEIIDEESRDPTSRVIKPENKPLILIELARAVALGKFEKEGQTHVHWVGGSGRRMTRSRFAALAVAYSPDGKNAEVFENPEFQQAVVAELAIPVADYRQWRRDRGRFDPLPPEFEAEGTPAPALRAPEPPVAAPQGPGSSQAPEGPLPAPQPSSAAPGGEDERAPAEGQGAHPGGVKTLPFADLYIAPPEGEATYLRDDRWEGIAVAVLKKESRATVRQIIDLIEEREGVNRSLPEKVLGKIGKATLVARARQPLKAISA
jgi:hypothetical protein